MQGPPIYVQTGTSIRTYAILASAIAIGAAVVYFVFLRNSRLFKTLGGALGLAEDVGDALVDAGQGAVKIGKDMTPFALLGLASGSKKARSSVAASCPATYTNMGLTCYRGPSTYGNPSRPADCAPGYRNMGLHCGKGLHVGTFRCYDKEGKESDKSDRLHGARCYPKCRESYTNNGETCGRNANTIGGVSQMTCPTSHPERIGGLCYAPCGIGFEVSSGIWCNKKS